MIRPLLRLPGILLLGALVLFSPLPRNYALANDVHFESNEGEQLHKYITLCAQPSSKRVRSLQALSSTERSRVWRLHLGLFLARHPTLTRDQQSIIIETLLLATPQMFETPEPSNPIWRSRVLEPIENVRRRGQQIFSTEEIAQIFAEVGGFQDLELLEKYVQFSRFSRSDRKTRFNQISPKERSDLWRAHFGLSLAQHPEWTDQQRSIVLEAIAIATPALFQIPKDDKWTRLVDEPIQLLAQRALLVFSQEEGATLFSELGGDEPKSHHAKLKAQVDCSCSPESSVSTCIYRCISSDCTILIFGCGAFWMYACTAKCSSSTRAD